MAQHGQNFYLLFIEWNRPHNTACLCECYNIKSRGTNKAGQTAPILGCSITETVQNQGMASLSGDAFLLTGAPGCFWRGWLPYDLTVALPSSIHPWWEALPLLFHSDKTCTHICSHMLSYIERSLVKRWERDFTTIKFLSGKWVLHQECMILLYWLVHYIANLWPANDG